jgi:predicted DNA-binding ribbon-helix-helix protein
MRIRVRRFNLSNSAGAVVGKGCGPPHGIYSYGCPLRIVISRKSGPDQRSATLDQRSPSGGDSDGRASQSSSSRSVGRTTALRCAGNRLRICVRRRHQTISRLRVDPRRRRDRIQGPRIMKSPVVKRSIVIAGHKTSVSLEDAFWDALKEIASERKATLSDLVAKIDSTRTQGNLSSAIRLFVLDHFRSGNGGAPATSAADNSVRLA